MNAVDISWMDAAVTCCPRIITGSRKASWAIDWSLVTSRSGDKNALIKLELKISLQIL